MFTKTFVFLIVIVIASSNVENCQKVLIDSDDFDGDCCVFVESSDVPVAIVVNVSKERRRGSFTNHNQTPNTSIDIVMKIKSERIYGRCNITALHENNSTIIKTQIEDNLPALLNKTLVENKSSKRPVQFNSSNISSKSSSQLKSEQHKHSNLNQGSDNTTSLRNDTNLDQFDTFNASTTKKYHEKEIIVEPNITNHFNTIRPDSNRESKHSTAYTPYFTTVLPDQPEERLSGSNESSDIFFPTEQTLETRTTSTNISSVATNGTKSIVDLDNRNAVDVPPLGCPNGQARDPSGTCIAPF